MSTVEYVNFWQANSELIGTVYRPGTHPNDWDSLLGQLKKKGVVGSRRPFDKDFTDTNRTKADVRPGFQFFHKWSIEEATALDDTPALLEQIRGAYQRALAAVTG